MRRNRRQWQYKAVVAETYHSCIICLSIIEPGELYLSRRKKLHTGRWATLAKCAKCVPLRERESNNG